MDSSFNISSLLCDAVADNFLISPCSPNDDHQLRATTDVLGGGDSVKVLPIQSDEHIMEMVNKECLFLPEKDYQSRMRVGESELIYRVDAIRWISKVVAHYKFTPLCAYLAVTYLDRFLSLYAIVVTKAKMMHLVAVTCLYVAAKIEEVMMPSIVNLQHDINSKYFLGPELVKDMELRIMKSLNWRLRAVTPFSFLDNFLCKIKGGEYPPQSIITQASRIILTIVGGVEYLEFRHSEIAAAVAIFVGVENQTADEVDKTVGLLLQFVEKQRVLKCLEIINKPLFKRILHEGQSDNLTIVVSQSPIGVLDNSCLSYKSDELTVGTCASLAHARLGTKRRRLFSEGNLVWEEHEEME